VGKVVHIVELVKSKAKSVWAARKVLQGGEVTKYGTVYIKHTF